MVHGGELWNSCASLNSRPGRPLVPPHVRKIIIRCFSGVTLPSRGHRAPAGRLYLQKAANCRCCSVQEQGCANRKYPIRLSKKKRRSLELCILKQSLCHFSLSFSRSATHRWCERSQRKKGFLFFFFSATTNFFFIELKRNWVLSPDVSHS